MGLALVLGAAACTGWVAAGYLVACMIWGKALLEVVNYMEHYGIVRDPQIEYGPIILGIRTVA